MKKNLTALALTFSFVFIGIIGTSMGVITATASKANNEIISVLDTNLMNYVEDGTSVSGGMVISLIDNLSLLGDGLYCEALVITGENEEGKVYKPNDGYRCSNSTDVDYINKSSQFSISLNTNKNNVINQIVFTQITNK